MHSRPIHQNMLISVLNSFQVSKPNQVEPDVFPTLGPEWPQTFPPVQHSSPQGAPPLSRTDRPLNGTILHASIITFRPSIVLLQNVAKYKVVSQTSKEIAVDLHL